MGKRRTSQQVSSYKIGYKNCHKACVALVLLGRAREVPHIEYTQTGTIQRSTTRFKEQEWISMIRDLQTAAKTLPEQTQ